MLKAPSYKYTYTDLLNAFHTWELARAKVIVAESADDVSEGTLAALRAESNRRYDFYMSIERAYYAGIERWREA